MFPKFVIAAINFLVRISHSNPSSLILPVYRTRKLLRNVGKPLPDFTLSYPTLQQAPNLNLPYRPMMLTVLSSKFSAIGNTDIKVVLCSAVGLTLLFLMYSLKVDQ
jgi:hypothetical protein